LKRRGIGTKAIPAGALASEYLEEAARAQIQIVCVSAVPPFGSVRARYLCKRLRAQFPEIKIVVGILNCSDISVLKKPETDIPADVVAGNLNQMITGILSLLPAATEHIEQTAFSS
jgi:hypothetical protein